MAVQPFPDQQQQWRQWRKERALIALERACKSEDPAERQALRSYGAGVLYLLGDDPLQQAIDRADEVEAKYNRLLSLLFIFNERLSHVEVRLGAPTPPTTGLLSVKGAAYQSGYSESMIRKLIRRGLACQKIGGRYFLDPETLPTRRKRLGCD
jgi:hypothetical protein